MLKPYNDRICLIRQQQQPVAAFSADQLYSAASIANALRKQFEEEIKKEGESKNESPDT